MPPTTPGLPAPQIAVVGGTGLYAFLDDVVQVPVSTPFGEPSAPVAVGVVDGRPVAFLPRHGVDHHFPPHRIPALANMWALRSLGVRQVLAPCAVGSLRADLGPGALVVPDQLLDRTRGRPSTFYDDGAVHVAFADPYCPRLRGAANTAAATVGWPATDGGTLAVVEGPRFSTRAESADLVRSGATLVGMTGMPEAVLARELALCYAAVALVTDRDVGAGTGEEVTHAEVLAVFARSTDRLRALLVAAVAAVPADRDCPCPHALDGLALPWPLP